GAPGDVDRARFIRLLCRYEALPEWHPGRDAPREEAESLLREHRRDWLGGVPEVKGARWGDLDDFGGGLLEGVALSPEVEREGLGEAAAAVPLRRLRLEEEWEEGRLRGLLGLERWRTLRRLVIPWQYSCSAAAVIAEAAHLSNLTHLHL